jgi:glycosyltransferase involved in cell wall biosynthesis
MEIAFIGVRGVPARYSGFETCVEQVGQRMVERGHTVTVYCRRRVYPKQPATYLGMELRYLAAVAGKHAETISHTGLAALRLVRSKRGAVVCMGVGNAPIVRLLEGSGRRAVFNVDGADWQRAKWGRAARRYLLTCESLAARSRSLLVADSQAVQKYYQVRYGRDSTLVPYGATAPRDTGTETLQRFGLKAGSYILFVGRLEPENGAHDYLEGVRLAGLGAPAVVVGDAPYAQGYIRNLKASAPAEAVFTGFQFGSDYSQFSANSRIFVLAAEVGGTHPVLVEQMAAGACILARSTDSNREVLGESGFFWRTPRELAARLRAVWADEDLRRRASTAAIERQRRLYDWEVVTDRYVELCKASLDTQS